MKQRLVFLSTALLILSASLTAGAAEKLSVGVDHAVFYNLEENSAYVEFYYSLYRNQLGFIGADTLEYSYAGVLATVHLFDEQGRVIDSASTYYLARAAKTLDQENDDGVRLFDYLPLKAAPGTYRAELTVIDDVSKKSGRVNMKVVIPSYDRAALSISDMELAYEIRDVQVDAEPAVNTRLVKEGRLVVPNTSGAYMHGVDDLISVYFELYGLDLSGNPEDQFVVNFKIKDSLGNVIHDFGPVSYSKPGRSAVLSNELDIGNLEAGEYFLSLEARDLLSGQNVLALKPFSLVGTPVAEAPISGEDADLIVNIAWYYLSEAEKIQVRKLSPKGKSNFIQQFWRLIDDDPSTPENPHYDNAVSRFIYANRHYSTHSGLADGWNTDRGRVYITYGPYNHETDLVMPGTTTPLIKWVYYDLEGGVIFIFASDDLAGGVEYRLVHSTYPRERYDPQWEERFAKEAPEDFWQHDDDKAGIKR